MKKRLVVIGGVAAGPKAVAKARRCDPEMETSVEGIYAAGDFEDRTKEITVQNGVYYGWKLTIAHSLPYPKGSVLEGH